METEHQKAVAKDKILKHLLSTEGFGVFMEQELGLKFYVIHTLCNEMNDYVVCNGHESHLFSARITKAGKLFIETSGYEKEYLREELKKETAHQKSLLEIQQLQSVIDTNKSVKTTNTIQKWLIGFATLFSAISLLISYWTYEKQQDTIIIVQPPKATTLHTEAPKQDTSYQNSSRNQPK